MYLNVGIIGSNCHGWYSLLDQEGIPYTIVADKPSANELSVLIIPDSIEEKKIADVTSYLREGGAAICSGFIFSKLSSSNVKESFIRYIIEEEDSHFRGAGLIDVGSVGYIPVCANHLRTNDGRFAVFVGESNGGKIVVLPVDAGAIMLDHQAIVKSFYSNTRRLPFEKVSLVSKNGLLRLVSQSLRILHHERGLPYIHKWYFPNSYRSVFAWRIDTDYSDESEIENLYKIIEAYRIPATWFIDVKSQKDFLAMFKQMEKQEIGLHCYEHATYPDFDRNKDNIRTALELLRHHGIEVKGYAAPFGYWNDKLGKVIDTFGFDYSSEFSYDYDNVPSYPLVGGIKSPTLQVPIHPVSIGSLRRIRFDESAMIQYYQHLIENKLYVHEPVILYHHPKNISDDVLKAVFEYINNQHLKIISVLDYSRWWKRRNDHNLQMTIEDQILHVTISNPAADVWLNIVMPNGRNTIAPIKPAIDFQNLVWTDTAAIARLPIDFERIRKFNPWIPFIGIQDKINGILFNRK